MLDAHIVKKRRSITVDIRFRAAAGERLAIFGPSGAGKSSILSCIAGLDQPDQGEIRVGGQVYFPPPLALNQRFLAYLTQKDLLFPHLSVAENVCFGLPRESARKNRDWLAELRQRLGLDVLWHVPARSLSGGQARRAALARMLARRPPLVLLDEPFTGLDRQVVRELIGLLDRWQKRLRFTLVLVGHEAEVVERLCPRVLALEKGRVVQEGSFEALREKPATATLAQLLAPL
jgi:ABC-type sulfate/molybdate transport systems ATPase subunit